MSLPKVPYHEDFAALALKIGETFGATQAQLAKVFSVAPVTIARWMERHPEFAEAVAYARARADTAVEESLFKKANGYEREEEKIFCNKDGLVTRVKYKAHYPPDTTSMIFWLKNRDRESWRDVNRTEVTGAEGAQLPVINITLNTPAGQQNIAPAIDTTKVEALPAPEPKSKSKSRAKKKPDA